uniref:CSD domain-containing protein n=1 Tax=viral metagenome TaxID=1070528 RepID=A0A6C0D5J8_9ZZZZ
MTEIHSNLELARLTGIVKWFNNKAGYGFVTALEGEQKGKDIFVHYSSIGGDNQQYRFLTQGEYIDFSLVKSDTEKYEYLAKKVTGVKGGPILCETRRLQFTEKRVVERKPPVVAPEAEQSREDGFVQVKPKSRGRPRKVAV